MSEQRGFSGRARIKARRSAVQALYQWHITANPLPEILAEFQDEEKRLEKADTEYFRDLVKGVGEHRNALEELMRSTLDRPVEKLDPVERCILWLSLYELQHHPEIPARVIINESVELAKMFGAEESHKYINSIVDKVARTVRRDETGNAVNG